MKQLGKRLARLRKDSGLTQEELALKAGLNRRTIIDLEAGTKAGVSTTTLNKLAGALKIRMRDLL